MIVERYMHPHGDEVARYRVNRHLLVGGRFLDGFDLERLVQRHKVTALLNVSTETSDRKIVEDTIHARSLPICEVGEPDDGSRRSTSFLDAAIRFVANHFDDDGNCVIYVHCDKGLVRSPSYAYALLRAVWGFDREHALTVIRLACARWIEFASPGAVRSSNYVAGIDDYLVRFGR